MPYDSTPKATSPATDEARRQLEICNACRYCEGYCDVFPALTRLTEMEPGAISHLASLCHNCRGCYYACQYTPPHEFAVNLPAALAEVRQKDWEDYAWPQPVARLFHRSGLALAAALIAGFAALIAAIAALRPESGEGFYATLSHNAMVAIFAPAFLLPLIALSISLRAWWSAIGGGRVGLADITRAAQAAGRGRNLDGGQGQGCNFEQADRFSNARRHAHLATLWGFMMCFAATSVATLMHYGMNWPAPYGFWTPPKLLGVPGGILLCLGSGALMALKLRADPALGATRVWGGEMGFTALLFFVSASGLVLYAATGTAAVPALLAVHLGAVLAFFLLIPYSKMVHGFYRFAALMADRRGA